MKQVDISVEDLVGQVFSLRTSIDSYERYQTVHRATVIELNPVPPDSLLVQLHPPIDLGKTRDLSKYEGSEKWIAEVELINRLVLIRRHGGTKVCPPCPAFPLIVHMYYWPDPPNERTTPVVWNKPDDWAMLTMDGRESEVRNLACVEAHANNPEFYEDQIPVDEDYRRAVEGFAANQNQPQRGLFKSASCNVLFYIYVVAQLIYLVLKLTGRTD